MYAAGFTTAFGAHAVVANLGVYTGTRHGSLLALGILLALYDGAEVLLKPVSGGLADRAGGLPVLIGGLLAFAAASGGFLLAGNAAALFAALLGQGAAAAAFSRPPPCWSPAALAGATAALSAAVGFLPSSATAPGSARSPPAPQSRCWPPPPP